MAVYAIVETGEEGVAALLEALGDERQPNRAQILVHLGATTLSQRSKPIALAPFVPVLVRLVNDRDLELASDAARILGIWGFKPEVALPALTNALHSSDAFLRMEAVRAIGRYGEAARSCEPALLRMLADSNAEVRFEACSALWLVGADALSAEQALRKALNDPDPWVRARASALQGVAARQKKVTGPENSR
jgi:HEAT repeat protein